MAGFSFSLHVFISFAASAAAESLLVMLSLLFAILDEARSEGAGARLAEYVTLVEEADGFDKTRSLANEHDDMEIYDKVPPPPPSLCLRLALVAVIRVLVGC